MIRCSLSKMKSSEQYIQELTHEKHQEWPQIHLSSILCHFCILGIFNIFQFCFLKFSRLIFMFFRKVDHEDAGGDISPTKIHKYK